jgi:hypothetical protein
MALTAIWFLTKSALDDFDDFNALRDCPIVEKPVTVKESASENICHELSFSREAWFGDGYFRRTSAFVLKTHK